jgi:hypothetical protein
MNESEAEVSKQELCDGVLVHFSGGRGYGGVADEDVGGLDVHVYHLALVVELILTAE